MELEAGIQAKSDGSIADSPESNVRDALTFASVTVDLFQQIINGLPEQIALVNDRWDILAVNDAWTSTAQAYGYELVPGSNYLDFCEARGREDHKPAGIAAAGIRAMDENGERSFRYIYTGHGAWEGRSFQLCISRFDVGGQSYATITRYDVSEIVNLRHLREDFASSLIAGQDIERRRMAREVHDSTMQLLAGLGLSLGQLRRTRRSKASVQIVDEMESMLGEAQRELRAISFLAHPPLLKELGLELAIKQLAGGFGRRTGLQITFHAHGSIRVGPTVELAIYRAVQEMLSNAHRHAQATEVSVGLYARHSSLHVVVADNGRGMPDRVRQGVGLASMRARVEELGGKFRIRPGNPGTVVRASIPLHADMRAVGGMALQAGTVKSNVLQFHSESNGQIQVDSGFGETLAS